MASKALNHKYVLIDNRSRDPRDTPFEYTVLFGDDAGKINSLGVGPLLNIVSVEMKHFIGARPITCDYIVFDIDELNGHLLTLDNNTTGSYAVASFDHAPNFSNRDACRLIKGDLICASKVTFDPPLSKLNRLTIKLLKYGGEPMSVDDYTLPDNTVVRNYDRHAMIFDIVTTE